MPFLSPSTGSSDGLVESFLHDMDALDHNALKPNTSKVTPLPKKRKQATHPSQNNPQTKKKKQPSWLKRKQELELLRQQTQAMETRVVYLQMKKTSPSDNSHFFNLQKEKTSALVEKQRCILAQNENMQLRSKLQYYMRQYEALQLAMATGEYQLKELQRVLSGTLRVELGTLRACRTHVFDMMERRLDARFHKLEYAYRAMYQPMTSIDTDNTDEKRRTWGCGVYKAGAAAFRGKNHLEYHVDIHRRRAIP
ncbi:hypothetical protein GN244_ATG12199 [Phytophthora infestans]|uniref:Uncharacterized protein n=1 Tax=Phytophthora infestans TaxID=4787 RepID=A0A833T8I2_PHYIN|nr:hypothetical protein GN244_ATG12199 [Phytophthora infestans]